MPAYPLTARFESIPVPICSADDCHLIARHNLIWSIGDRDTDPSPLCPDHAHKAATAVETITG